jgi:ribosomal protein S13
MKKDMTPPRTHRDAFAAQVLGEIDTLLDKVQALTGTINDAGAKIQVMINQLEGAGEKYNQAVLAANLRSKNEMLAYLKTISTTSIAKTIEEQREIVQGLIREAVRQEMTTFKKVLSETRMNHQMPFIICWGGILISCTLTAFIGSAITVALIKYLGVH